MVVLASVVLRINRRLEGQLERMADQLEKVGGIGAPSSRYAQATLYASAQLQVSRVTHVFGVTWICDRLDQTPKWPCMDTA